MVDGCDRQLGLGLKEVVKAAFLTPALSQIWSTEVLP
jgi:hypothetical protein